jgi:CO/xanthine dehydrogenase Mo-binding subunit
VEQAPTGGAFGGKEDIPSELCARVAVAAKVLNRPVRMVYSRSEDIQLTSKRHPFKMKYRVGVTREGKLTAAEVLLEENAGAYATLSTVVSYRAAAQALGPYVVSNVKVDSKSYYTNLPPNGAFRGFGSPQAAFGHERMMDIIAAELHMDPVEFRLKNIIHPGEETSTGQQLTEGVGAGETLRKAVDASRWKLFQPGVTEDGRYLKGLGVSTVHYGNCLGAAGWHMDGAGVKLQLHENGTASVAFGLVEMGQGALTVVVQMVAEALGISPWRVRVLPTSTHHVPDSGPSVASRNVVMTGNAVRDAARKLLPILKKTAAELLECAVDDVSIAEDKVTDVTTGNQLAFEELVQFLFQSNRSVEVQGWWHVRELEYDPQQGLGEAYFAYSFATHVAEVRVDRLTGRVHVDRIWAVHDVGRAINPAGVEGQVEGGTTQGTGWAVTERFQYQEGKVLTSNLSTYLLPTVQDVAQVDTVIVEAPEPEGPWGAKGIGEPAIIPTAAAIVNAVSSAVGVQIRELPLTPEKILSVLEGLSPQG